MDLHPTIMAGSPNYRSNCTSEEYQTFEYYHSQYPQAQEIYYDHADGAPDSAYDSTLSCPDEYAASTGPFTSDGMICGESAQGLYGGYDEYSSSEPTADQEDKTPHSYLAEYGSQQSWLIASSAEACYTSLSEHDSYEDIKAAENVPLSKLSTYSELMPHVLNENYHCRTTLESPIRLSVPLERPQTQPVYVSPSECQGSCEPEDQQPQRHHPYARSSRRTRSQDGSIESRATKELKKRKSTRSLRRIRVPELASPSASADTPSPTRSEFSSRSSRSPRTPTNGDISDSREDEDILLISYAMDVQRDLTKKGKRKRRDAVTLACYFCRKRKIACKQPEEGSEDKSCGQCSSRHLECEYPTESRRGLRRSADSPC